MNSSMLPSIPLLMSSILAGFCIGLGGTVNLIHGGIIGAVLFTFGLITVVHYRYKLYTGTAGFVENKNDLINLIYILLGNIIGCFILALGIHYAIPTINESASQLIEKRLLLSYPQGLTLSILCGFIMTTAVEFARKDKFFPLLFGVPIFICSGYLHSIAEAFYYALGLLNGTPLTFELISFYIVLVIGNFLGCNLYRIAKFNYD